MQSENIYEVIINDPKFYKPIKATLILDLKLVTEGAIEDIKKSIFQAVTETEIRFGHVYETLFTWLYPDIDPKIIGKGIGTIMEKQDHVQVVVSLHEITEEVFIQFLNCCHPRYTKIREGFPEKYLVEIGKSIKSF